LLFTLEAQREHSLARAYQYASQGKWQQALAISEGVDTMRRGEDSLRLLAVGSLMKLDFPRAWQCYLKARRKADEGG
jgi:hypothetical protein